MLKILQIDNKVRAIIRPLLDFIKEEEGEGELKRLEKRINDLGGRMLFREASKKKYIP